METYVVTFKIIEREYFVSTDEEGIIELSISITLHLQIYRFSRIVFVSIQLCIVLPGYYLEQYCRDKTFYYVSTSWKQICISKCILIFLHASSLPGITYDGVIFWVFAITTRGTCALLQDFNYT